MIASHRTTLAAAFALALALCLAPSSSSALEGFRCQHTAQCTTSEHELCVADSLTSTWGTCRKMRVLP